MKTRKKKTSLQTYVVPLGMVCIVRATSPENAAKRVQAALDAIDWDASLGCEVDCVEVSVSDIYVEE